MKIQLRGWRKFTMALLGIVLSFIALSMGWIGEGIWFQCLTFAGGLYIAGNAASDYSFQKYNNKDSSNNNKSA